ncbi:MAG TPA: hypothetical protein VEV42_10140 [Pyrinomonadaceae bacterium]|nr:hypothetical protein [Pyrinomonadaceae bacterium]
MNLKFFTAHPRFFRTFGAVLYVSLLPIIFCHDLLLDIWQSGVPRAWDGTGHFGIAQIYTQSIFPDTFGWTNAHLGGMPFPNFYPPMFFWCVALLTKTHILSFTTAFKLMATVPLLLIPAAIWFLALSLSRKNYLVAFWAALVSVYPLTSARFGGQMQWASGLDYFSTLAIGMYTQPLGFVLFLVWYAVYFEAHRRTSKFVGSSILLALAVLANYLNVIVATIIVAATLFFDLLRLLGNRSDREARRVFVAHTLSPIISLGLTLFWVVPMLNSYQYFVTRPFSLVIITRDMIIWFVLAAIGIFFWLRTSSRATYPHVASCLILGGTLGFAASVSPRWLPLQANRLSPILYFLLAIPVGYAVTAIYASAKSWLLDRVPRLAPISARAMPVVFGLFLLLVVGYFFRASTFPTIRWFNEYQARLGFYPRNGSTAAPVEPSETDKNRAVLLASLTQHKPSDIGREDLFERVREEHVSDAALALAAKSSVDGILNFAKSHNDGRYAVEIPAQYRTDAASFDGRALNSYLGAQGNQTLTVVFREASPNSIFLYPQIAAVSHNPDNFGFSSVLGDDLDFTEQPPAKHLERLRYLGARYIVINSDRVKERLAQEPAIGERYDFGTWTLFELRDGALPPVRQLSFRPALVVTDFTAKGRRANEYNFIRWAEEQFADGWFDVLLARAPTTTLDNLGSLAQLNQFGAIILDNYKCDRCDLVYRQLKEFSQTRPIILLANDVPLFNRIRASIDEFPKMTIIERNTDDWQGPWLDNYAATRRYGSSPQRAAWKRIREVLEQNKVAVEPAAVQGEVQQNQIQLNYNGQPLPEENSVPVLIATTYHPNWRGEQTIYPATPMFMLTFVRHSTTLKFARLPVERAGVWLSALTLVGLVGFVAWQRLGHKTYVTADDADKKRISESNPRHPRPKTGSTTVSGAGT